MDTRNSILQQLHFPELDERRIELFVKRDDLIHPIISGNKWRKLKYSIQFAKSKNNLGLITFGGAYSNHLVATASACQLAGLNSVGIVRGEELNVNSNETLKKCHELGMKLVFVDRLTYSLKEERAYLEELLLTYPNHHVVPEGGSDYYGMIGCQEMVSEFQQDFNQVWLACGTGTTAAGLLTGLEEMTQLHVVPVLKGFDTENTIRNLLSKSAYEQEFINDCISKLYPHTDFHFGGYAKYTEELLGFIQRVYREQRLPLDPVYTGKALFALIQTLTSDDVYTGKKVLFIHTGGLQGAASIEKESGIKLFENQ